jgi:hypothetical protein
MTWRLETFGAAAWLAGLLLPVAAAGALPDGYRNLVFQYGLGEKPSPAKFWICHRHGCHTISAVSLSPSQWATVRGLFPESAADAASERASIAAAVAYLETVVGEQIGASRDKGGNLAGFLAGGSQLDCVDESTNTTSYLTLLEQDGLLRWHRVEPRSSRGYFIFGWPHNTAVISEIDGGARWAVDSWFHDNGVAPEIVPLAQWKDGWSPEGFDGF